MDKSSLRKARSIASGMQSEHRSLLALTEGDPNALFQRPPTLKQTSWTAGPTKGFKQGVSREWAEFMMVEDDLEWSNDEGELGRDSTQDPRILGRRLLFTQLAAATPYYAVHDDEESCEIVNMLLERWIEAGVIRKRVAEWESVMGMGRRQEETQPGLGWIEETIRFDFRRS
jgi:hypothetical protein